MEIRMGISICGSPQAEEPDGLWILDLKSIKSIIHRFEMDLDLQIKTPWILDGFGFTKEIHEIHKIHDTS